MKKRYTFTLDEEIVKTAKKRAIDEDISLSAKIEKLLAEGNERDKKMRVDDSDTKNVK